MGTVYKVQYEPLDKVLALKVLKPEFATDQSAIKRFEQEGKSASTLSHPNMVSVYEYGLNKGGCPYILMDYLDGPSLEAVLKENGGFLDVERALNIFLQLTNSLNHAHQKGIIHRDIKPSNVILLQNLGSPDFVKVLDFGIAKVLPVGDRRTLLHTQTGDIFGTPLYMSPEQCKGDKLDFRSDIYSLGCLMYEVLSGSPPFAGDNPIRIILHHLNDRPARFSARFPELAIPVGLESLVLACLEKDPDTRYQSMRTLAGDLELIGEGKPITFQSKLTPQRVKDLRNRLDRRAESWSHWTRLGIVTAAIGAFVGVSIYLFLHRLDSGMTWNDLYVKGQEKFDQGDYKAAQLMLEKSLDVAEVEGAQEPQKKNKLLMAGYENLLDLFNSQNDVGESLKIKQKLNQLQVSHDQEQKSSGTVTRNELDEAMRNYSGLQKSSPQSTKIRDQHSTELCQQACDELTLYAPPEDLVQRCAYNFARALDEKRKYTNAASLLTEAIHQSESNQSPSNLLGQCHLELGRAYIGLAIFDKSKSELGKALQVFEDRSDIQQCAAVYYEQGVDFQKTGQYDLAEREFRHALSIFQKLDPPAQTEIMESNFQLARLCHIRGSGDLAAEYFKNVLDADESLIERSNRQNSILAQSLHSLGEHDVVKDNLDLSKPLFVRASAIADRIGIQQNPGMLTNRLYLTVLYKPSESTAPLLRALASEIIKSVSLESGSLGVSETVSSLVLLGNYCSQRNDYDRAEILLRNAFELAMRHKKEIPSVILSDTIVQLDYLLSHRGQNSQALELAKTHVRLFQIKYSFSGIGKAPPLKWLQKSLDDIASGKCKSICTDGDTSTPSPLPFTASDLNSPQFASLTAPGSLAGFYKREEQPQDSRINDEQKDLLTRINNQTYNLVTRISELEIKGIDTASLRKSYEKMKRAAASGATQKEAELINQLNQALDKQEAKTRQLVPQQGRQPVNAWDILKQNYTSSPYRSTASPPVRFVPAMQPAITIDYVYQPTGRSFNNGRPGRIVLRPPQFGFLFGQGIANSTPQPDDLRVEYHEGKVCFRNFHLGRMNNGFYDAGVRTLQSVLEAAPAGYAWDYRDCLVGHVYVVRTYDGRYAKFIVLSIENSS